MRHDLWLSESSTTNNRMALRSVIEALSAVAAKRARFDIVFTTDSRYIVDGMTQWVHSWARLGWKRKGGAIENLDLWRELVAKAGPHAIGWKWVRGHAGHPKNEYANELATRAAAGRLDSGGLVASGFLTWLDAERRRGRYLSFEPDGEFEPRS